MVPETDKVRISQAIRDAELRTRGEIFCVIARQSSDYRLMPVVWAAVVALIVPLPLIFLAMFTASAIYMLQMLTFVGLAIALSHPALRFRLVPRRLKHDRAHAEAMRQFFAQGLHLTEQRTGVLIFASEAERYAEIVADAGINRKVAPAVWDAAIATLIDAIRAGRPGDGFVAAVAQCGKVLEEHFPLAPGADNPHELPDRLIEI